MNTELNRYAMSFSQADNAIMVVYAHDLEEAEEIFENGDYVLEPMVTKSFIVSNIDWDTGWEDVDLPTEVSVTLELEPTYDRDTIHDSIEDYLTDEYDWCVNSFCFDEL